MQDVRIGFTIYACCFQGLRLGEVISLKCKDVDLRYGELKVVDGKNPRRRKSGYGKDRIVPINKMFIPIWKAWEAMNAGETYVIPDVSHNGKRAPEKTLLRRFQKRLQVYLKKADLLEVDFVQSNGVERYNYHFHTFRHVCGANLRRAGMALENIRDFLGHADVISTQIYTELTKEDIKEASHIAYAYPKSHLGMQKIPQVEVTVDRETMMLQKEILDKAVTQTYKKKEITARFFKNKKPPILGDLYKELELMDRKASPMEKVTYRALLNRLYMYTKGVFAFLNKQTTLKFDNKFVCFNIGDMPKQVKPLVMFMILDFVYMKMKESKERKLLVCDEAWSLLGHAEEASYIFEIVKTCRKFNMGLLLITQDVADLINSKAGHAVLANSSYSLLLRQKPSVIDSVVKTFHLSQMEKEYLLTATLGRGVLILDNEHQELEVVASPKEHQIITTNPDEILEQKEEAKEEKETKMDLNQIMYYGNTLTKEQKNILHNNGYKARNFVPIEKPRQKEVWLKENDIESLDHTFLVENIKEELLKHTKDVKLHVTKKPDIVFKNKKGKEIAIEVETGFGFGKHKKRLKEKFFQVYMEYKKNAIIVVTQKDLKDKYQRLVPLLTTINRNELPDFINKQFNI
ncbi:MAG: tyrosine-type recombinase/integrase [Nanoarchaeota archaeon]